MTATRANLKVLYAAGPGHVIGTCQHWANGEDDPSQVSVTYSSQFLDVCRQLDAEALVITTHPEKGRLVRGKIRVEHRPTRLSSAGPALYHIGQTVHLLRLVLLALRFKADVALVSDVQHWFLLGALSWFGVRIVPSLHCAFWPVGHRPQRLVRRLIWKLNRQFWQRVPAATICVSPQCEKQVRELTANPAGPILQTRAHYRRNTFASVAPPPAACDTPKHRASMCLMYAGRIEQNKGVFDLFEAALQLQKQYPGRFEWQICGEGSDLNRLQDQVRLRDLARTFQLRGRLNQPQMIAAYSKCHIVVVPTTSHFAEGLNKVAVEGILAGRPVLTNRFSNALEVLGEAIESVEPNNPAAIAAAIVRLADDRTLYEQRRRACSVVQEQFYDPDRSWAAALRKVLTENL